MGLLDEIRSALIDDDGWFRSTPLEREIVLRWLKTDDLDTAGYINHFLFDKDQTARVSPPLTAEQEISFKTSYFEKCVIESARQDHQEWRWAVDGFELSHAVVFWFIEVASDRSIPAERIESLRDWLADLIKSHEHMRDLFVSALSDHVLIDRRQRRRFARWKDAPELGKLFEWAWAED